MMITLFVTCAQSSTLVVNLGNVTIAMSMRMIILGLCVGSDINEILKNYDPLPMYPYVN